MKNIKLMFFALTTMFFLAMGSVNAQETVIIRGSFYVGRTAEIMTISPDYKITETSNNKGEKDEGNFLIALKKELDKWIIEGYVISESSTVASSSSVYSILHPN